MARRLIIFALITRNPFEEEGDFFADHAAPALVPVDNTNTYYSVDNLALEGLGKALMEVAQLHETPEIIDEIFDYLEE